MKPKPALPLTIAIFALTFANSPVSANYQEATAHIDLDGSMLGYMSFEGDGQEIGTALNEIYRKVLTSTPEMPPVPVDFNQLLENLGFGSLTAIAMSSKDVEPGLHRNRSVALMNGSPKGLFAIYDTKPLNFSAAEMAPADATGAMTASVNLKALSDTATDIMQQVMGPMGASIIQQQLTRVIPESDVTYGQTIELLSGKWDAFWHQSYSAGFQQQFKFWISIEGAGELLPRLRAVAEEHGVAFIEDDTMLKANFSQLLGPQAPFSIYAEAPKQSGALILYSHNDWTPDSIGPRLVDDDAFKALATRLPHEGITFNYSIGTDLSPMLEELAAIPQAAAYMGAAESLINLLIGDFLKPSMAVTYMAGEDMVADQYAGYSTKQVLMALPTITAGGIGAAMAIPAFQKVRATSHEKAVTNNLRQIASAADQYFLENGVTEVHIDKLVGGNGYIRTLPSVAGESYEDMIIRQGEDIRVTLPDGSEISVLF